MTRITDEQLSAYLDGELSPADARALEAGLAADPSLAARLGALKSADAQLRQAFPSEDAGPVPARFEKLLTSPTNAPPARARSMSIPWRQAGAIAASFVAGLILQAMLSDGNSRRDVSFTQAGLTISSGEITAALDRARTGEGQKLGDQTLMVRLSFEDGAGRFCREFQLGAASGLSCKVGAGWTVEAMASRPSASTSGYEMAGGPGAAEIEAARSRIGMERVFDADDEARAIASGWAKARP